MKLAKSCGDPGAGWDPTFASASCTGADRSPSLIVAFSRSTMLAGVPAGATTPVQNVVM